MLTFFRRVLQSERYIVRGDSMTPTLRDGQHLLVDVEHYRTETPARGDIVLVSESWSKGKRTVKRVLGCPGEEIAFEEGSLLIDGVHFQEAYSKGLPEVVGLERQRWRLGVDEYFLMGDNRPRSTDSRRIGPAHLDSIIGEVWWRYWPLRLWGSVG